MIDLIRGLEITVAGSSVGTLVRGQSGMESVFR